MRFTRTVELALIDLSSHAFRSFLTALGVIFGVGAVVAMMAISEGSSRDQLRAIQELGIDIIEVRSVKPADAPTSQVNSAAVEYGITLQDITHLRDVFDNVLSVVPVRNARKDVYVKGVRTDVQVLATTPEFLALSNSGMWDSRGRFLADMDGEGSQTACVVGVDAARQLFTFEDPMGQTIAIGSGLFRVVGILYNRAEMKMAGSLQLNNSIFIHIAAADSIFGKTSHRQTTGAEERIKVEADYIYVKVKDDTRLENTAARLRAYFQTAHDKDRPDYQIVVPLELLRQKEETLRRSAVVLASIAAISLLVGGIGIMNIMLANIYERTKEIGTRRALGAKKHDILFQFLTEAVLLTTLGGVVGVISGWGITRVVSQYVEWPPVITVFSIVISLGVSVVLGVVFGTYPAWKAANLDPITALRSE